jgi:hypothetical protein
MPAGATYEPIATSSPSGVLSVTFSSLGSYTDIVAIVRPIYASGGSDVSVQFNGDTATNYSNTNLAGDGTTASSARDSSDTYIRTGGSIANGQPAMQKWNFFSYAGSTKKTVLVEVSNDLNGSGRVRRAVGLWRSTAAITSIKFEATGGINFASGSMITLYGIKAA